MQTQLRTQLRNALGKRETLIWVV